MTGVPSADSGDYSAIPDAVAAPWDLRRGTRQAWYYSRRPSGPASLWGRGPATSRVRPRGALSSHGQNPGPPPFRSPGLPHVPRTFWCAHPHSDQGVRGRRAPPLPRAHAGPSFVGPTECYRAKYHAPAMTTPPAGAGRTTAATRTISRMTATRAAFPQCTSYSVRPLYPRNLGENDDFRAPTHVHRPSLQTIKGGGGLPLAGAVSLTDKKAGRLVSLISLLSFTLWLLSSKRTVRNY